MTVGRNGVPVAQPGAETAFQQRSLASEFLDEHRMVVGQRRQLAVERLSTTANWATYPDKSTGRARTRIWIRTLLVRVGGAASHLVTTQGNLGLPNQVFSGHV